jgi:hypothetical protein
MNSFGTVFQTRFVGVGIGVETRLHPAWFDLVGAVEVGIMGPGRKDMQAEARKSEEQGTYVIRT